MVLTVTATLTLDWLHNVVKLLYKIDTIKLFDSNQDISAFEYYTITDNINFT